VRCSIKKEVFYVIPAKAGIQEKGTGFRVKHGMTGGVRI
jgi:hypothetical protein